MKNDTVIGEMGSNQKPQSENDNENIATHQIEVIKLNSQPKSLPKYERIRILFDLNEEISKDLVGLPISSLKNEIKIPNIDPAYPQKVDYHFRKSQLHNLKYKTLPLISELMKKWLKVIRVNELNPIIIEKGFMCREDFLNNILKEKIITDYDLYIKVQGTPSKYGQTILAAGKYCFTGSLDYHRQRPLAGIIKINPNYFSVKESEFSSQIILIIHELVHVLAFQGDLYFKYVDKNGNELGIDNVIKEIDNQWSITTPKVLQVARDHFKCPDIKGVYLENEGGEGSKDEHWERRILHNEFMTASDMDYSPFSEFTFALLEDSGWYQVDYSEVQPLFWGRNAGCEFYFKGCNAPLDAAVQRHFCFTEDKIGCSYDKRFIGKCEIDDFADTCMYYNNIEDKENNCIRSKEEKGEKEFLGWNYGPNSGCFDSKIISIQNALEKKPPVRCHKFECSLDKKSLKIYYTQSAYIECNEEDLGKYLNVKSLQYSQGLYCPTDFEQYCNRSYKNCLELNFCSGNGICNEKNECICQKNYFGEDCSILQL